MLIYIAIILTILVVLTLVPLLIKPPLPAKALNFENDILFLNYLIEVEIQDYKKYVIDPSKAAGRALLTDKEITDYRENMVIKIYSYLSPNYKANLAKYFSEVGLNDYIVNTINNKLVDQVLKYNKGFFTKSTIKKDDGVNVRTTDIE